MPNTVLVTRLVLLSRNLEAKADKGNDWALARHFEDRIGAGQFSDGDVLKAEALLNKYQF
jgi:hypothetical protein